MASGGAKGEMPKVAWEARVQYTKVANAASVEPTDLMHLGHAREGVLLPVLDSSRPEGSSRAPQCSHAGSENWASGGGVMGCLEALQPPLRLEGSSGPGCCCAAVPMSSCGLLLLLLLLLLLMPAYPAGSAGVPACLC
jgi:hypothetical protein